MIGLYLPRDSLLHRLPAGAKLLGLLIIAVAVVPTTNLWLLAAGSLAVTALYPIARIPLRVFGRQLRVIVWFLALICVFQLLTAGWERAAVLSGQLFITVMLAALVTLSTRTSDMLAVFERVMAPVAKLGARPDRIALVLALTVRCVPMVAAAWRSAQEACLARGVRRMPHRMVVPVVVRLIRMADSLGDALAARGIDR